MATAATEAGKVRRAALSGPVTLAVLSRIRAELDRLGPVEELDLSEVTELDTAGAWSIASFQAAKAAKGHSVALIGVTEKQNLLIQTVASSLPDKRKRRRRLPHHEAEDLVVQIGRTVTNFATSMAPTVGFLGLVLARLVGTILRPSRLRVTALVHHMHHAGLDAVPIVVSMGFLIGIVLAFQGASQLEQFGAEIYVVDLISISMLRELGILLTAIIVAGRSSSAFTAAIGSMKSREEIDAMRVLGLDPIELLVLPRVLALQILLPIIYRIK